MRLAIEGFLKWGQPKWRPKTQDAYQTALKSKLLPWTRGRIQRTDQLDSGALADFDTHLRGQGLAENSRKTYLRHINGFLSWSRDHAGGLEVKVQISKSRPTNKDVLTRADMKALEAAAQLERDRLVIRLLCDTGMRLGELAALRKDDLSTAGELHLKVRGKTGERQVTISPTVYARLRTYLTQHRPDTNNRALFVSNRRWAGEYAPLAPKSIYGIVKDAHRMTGSTKRVYPHLLRHSLITYRLERRHDLSVISAETGASPTVLLENYSHPSMKVRHALTLADFDDD